MDSIDGERIAPATPFWEGYKRSASVHAELVQALAEALISQPTMRLGQMLIVALGEKDQWHTYDEVIIHKLLKFAHGETFVCSDCGFLQGEPYETCPVGIDHEWVRR